jgi:hypothetical protein
MWRSPKEAERLESEAKQQENQITGWLAQLGVNVAKETADE